jgi:nucleotide-binding universal stress UspA family protein
MKVLIGYDGSPSADAALEELKRAGLPDDTKILVATVASIWMPAPNFEIYEAATASRRVATTVAQLQHQTERTLKEAEEMADEAAARIKSDFPDWQVGTAVLSGDAASEIIRKATEWQADLIVVGSQNRSAIGRFFLGSVSQKIVIEANCSVRVARGGDARIDKNAARRIVAGIDNSESRDSIIETIAQRHWTPDTEVLILTGIEAFAEAGISAGMQLDSLDRVQSTAAARLNAVGLKASAVVKGSDAKNELLIEAEKWNADCIFVGTRDIRGTLDRFLIGSVSAGLAANAPCSVEVVRAHAV